MGSRLLAAEVEDLEQTVDLDHVAWTVVKPRVSARDTAGPAERRGETDPVLRSRPLLSKT
jgi:hypothetical protein